MLKHFCEMILIDNFNDFNSNEFDIFLSYFSALNFEQINNVTTHNVTHKIHFKRKSNFVQKLC